MEGLCVSGGWEGTTVPSGKVSQANAVGSDFKEERIALLKHGSARGRS